MQAVVPATGWRRQSNLEGHTKSGPLVRVAGKPVLGHVLDDLVESPLREVVVVVGAAKDAVVDYATEHYGTALELEFVEQEHPEGLGHAVYQARPRVDGGPLCIVYGDALFEERLERVLAGHRALDRVDGSVGVTPVDDPSNHGVVAVESGRVRTLETRPENPPSNLALGGVCVVEDAEWLFAGLAYLIDNGIRTAGDEYQLTAALYCLLEDGAEFGTVDVGEWYDCSRPAALLAANRAMLEEHGPRGTTIQDTGSVVLEPADIGDEVSLEGSAVGPYVSIDDGATVVDARVTDAIVGRDSTIRRANLANSIVGDETNVEGTPDELTVGDSDTVQL